jgi:hypothetical protein
MQQRQLPHRQLINLGAIVFFGIPALIFSQDIWTGRHVDEARLGLLWFGIPLLLLLLAYLPFFRFKPADKVAPTEALLRLPVRESALLIVVVMLGMGAMLGLMLLLKDNDPMARPLLAWCGPPLILLLLAVNSRRVLLYDDLLPDKIAAKLAVMKADPGEYVYTEAGFGYGRGYSTSNYKWDDVQRIAAYRTDNLYVDRIHLQLQTVAGGGFVTHEDILGWHIFCKQLFAHLPGVDPVWELRVITAPYGNPILVYEKDQNLAINWQTAFLTP